MRSNHPGFIGRLLGSELLICLQIFIPFRRFHFKNEKKKPTTQRSNIFSSEKKENKEKKQKQNRYSWHRHDRDQYSNILRLRRSRKAQFYVHGRSISSRFRAHEEKRGTIHWVSTRVHSLSSREAWSFQVNNCAVATRRETERARRKRPKKIKIILQSTYTHARTTSEREREGEKQQQISVSSTILSRANRQWEMTWPRTQKVTVQKQRERIISLRMMMMVLLLLLLFSSLWDHVE